MVYRYGLGAGGRTAGKSADQIACMVGKPRCCAAERYYPAFQLACWGGAQSEGCVQVAIASESYGRA